MSTEPKSGVMIKLKDGNFAAASTLIELEIQAAKNDNFPPRKEWKPQPIKMIPKSNGTWRIAFVEPEASEKAMVE